MPTPRTKRIEPLLQRMVSSAILKLVPEVYSQTQISRVRMSRCLRYADLYMTGEEPPLAKLQQEAGRIKRMLSKLELRYLPELRFHADKKLVEEMRMDALLRGMEEAPS